MTVGRMGGLPLDFVDLMRQLHPETQEQAEVLVPTGSLEASRRPALTVRLECGEPLDRLLGTVARTLPRASLTVRRNALRSVCSPDGYCPAL